MGNEHNDDIFDYSGLAAYVKLAHGTPRHWVSAGKIPYIKLGSRVMFSRKEIDRWLETRKQLVSRAQPVYTGNETQPLPFGGEA
jgi:excisionase family DNA binding protein